MASVLPAPSLNRNERARSLNGKSKKHIAKSVLTTPYKIAWPTIEKKTEEIVLHKITEFFEAKKLRQPISKEQDNKKLSKEEKKKRFDEWKASKSDEDKNLESQLVIGIQAVTRHLEKDQLRLTIVDRSAPWQLHKHLIQLAGVRGCPALALEQLDEVASLLSVPRMGAFGFKKLNDGDLDTFTSLVEFIAARCPSIDLPWMECEQALLDVKEEGNERIIDFEEELALDVKGERNEELVDKKSFVAEVMEPDVKDYSHLYVYKGESIRKVTSKFDDSHFITFSKSDDDEDDLWNYKIIAREKNFCVNNVRKEKVTIAHKQKIKPSKGSKPSKGLKRKASSFVEASIGQLQKNVHKKKVKK